MGTSSISWSGKNTGSYQYTTLDIAWVRKYLFLRFTLSFSIFFLSFLVSLIVHAVFNETNNQENIYKHISVITLNECITEQVLQTDTETCGNRRMNRWLQRTSEMPYFVNIQSLVSSVRHVLINKSVCRGHIWHFQN